MRKGIVFTMDAAYAFYIALLVMSTTMVIPEAGTNYSDDPLALTRLTKDIYEVRKYNQELTLPTFIKNGSACDGKPLIASVQSFAYDEIQYDSSWTTKSGVSKTSEKICYG
jgi:hypothetical protein